MKVIFLVILLIIVFGLIWFLNKRISEEREEFINNKIEDFLLKLKGTEFVYIPNGGNGGDSLIACGTYHLFDQLGLKYQIGKWNENYQNKLLVYGGGGNFNGKIYNGCADFIQRNHPKNLNNQIILLPHTITNNDELLKELDSNVILMCRERYSYKYVTELVKYPENIYLFDDMAFQLQSMADDIKDENNNENNNNENNNKNNNKNDKYQAGNFFRTDDESKDSKLRENSKDNRDLSLEILYDPSMCDKELVFKNTEDIFREVNKYQEINTDRLHIAIVGSLLNKKVNFYQNNYFKNKAVYEYSLKDKYPKTKLLD